MHIYLVLFASYLSMGIAKPAKKFEHCQNIRDYRVKEAHEFWKTHPHSLLIDVRTSYEFNDSRQKDPHILGSLNIDYRQTQNKGQLMKYLKTISKDIDLTTPLILYCRSGRRANIAKAWLLKHGFNCVINAGKHLEWLAMNGNGGRAHSR